MEELTLLDRNFSYAHVCLKREKKTTVSTKYIASFQQSLIDLQQLHSVANKETSTGTRGDNL